MPVLHQIFTRFSFVMNDHMKLKIYCVGLSANG